MLKLAILSLMFVSINCYRNPYYYSSTTTTTQPSVIFTPSICSANNAYCFNGGTCQMTGVSVECLCKFGYVGSRCELTIDACAGVKCADSNCQPKNSNEFQCDNSYAYSSYGEAITPYTLTTSSCDPYILCQNGGWCYLGRNSQGNLTHACFCPGGFTGFNCEQQYSYGPQSQSQGYYNSYSNYYSADQSYKLSRFGQTFLLMNTEITDSGRNISVIEFTAQSAGDFLFAFVKFPGCGAANQPSCAEMIHDKFQQNNQNGNWSGFNYQNELDQAFFTASFLIHTDYSGFFSKELPGGFLVEKGTMLVLTQLDGMIGSPAAFTTNRYPDFFIDVNGMGFFTLSRINLTNPYQYTNQYMYASGAGGQSQNQTQPPTPNWACPVKVTDLTKVIRSDATDPSNKCKSAICVNGGTCNWDDATSTYTCSCPAGTSGAHCQII